MLRETSETKAEETGSATGQADVRAAPGPVCQRWEDLLPPGSGARLNDAYARLSPSQLADLAMLARLSWLLSTGRADADGGMEREARRIRQAFTGAGLDADWLLSQRDAVRQNRIRRSYNPEVDGRPVKLFGVVVPLAWQEGFAVTEFLLTPTSGTCSHLPPPPWTQVAHVRTAEPIDARAWEAQQGERDLWVWVEGTIRYGVSSHLAFRVDGMMRFDAAYAIEPVRITPASALELEQRAAEARRAAEALLYPRLTDLIRRR